MPAARRWTDKYRLPLPEISAKFRIEISTKEKH